jgi:hypothetical protein
MVLTQEQARQLSVGEFAGARRLVMSTQQTWFADGALELRGQGDPAFRFAVFPALAAAPHASSVLTASKDGLFQSFAATLPARTLQASFKPLREAGKASAIMIGGAAKAAMQPLPESWRHAAAWSLDLPTAQLKGVDDALLELDFVGDIGRLFDGARMLDDWYYSGYGWQYSLKGSKARALTLSVLPLRSDAPIYLPKEARPQFGTAAQVAQLRAVRVTPVYRLSVKP